MVFESWLEPPEFPEIDCDCGAEDVEDCVCDDEGCGSCNSERGCRCDDLYEAWRDEQD